ncbi:hypothetical protein [Mariniphaga sp.]|uniref:hypothetical protein n=1 Tax=Mariniphaga sp. TaxID=1954475 RepID=UPI00356467BF
MNNIFLLKFVIAQKIFEVYDFISTRITLSRNEIAKSTSADDCFFSLTKKSGYL